MSTAPQYAQDTAQSAALKESLGNSLLINTVKLFSLLAKADSNVSQAERDYVKFYLDSIYHAPVAQYLYEQFEYFLSETIDAEQAAAQIRTGFSYENRVFILMKVYELAASDSMDDVPCCEVEARCETSFAGWAAADGRTCPFKLTCASRRISPAGTSRPPSIWT